MLKITKTLDNEHDQVAVEVGDFDITDPFVSECGRFEVDPHQAYGIDPKLAELLNALNCYLRGESAVSETDAEQQQYAEHGYGSCPQCGSDQVEGNEFDVEQNRAFQACSCAFCGAQWSDDYQLTGYTLSEPGRFDDEDTDALEEHFADQVLADSNPEQFMGIEIERARDLPDSGQNDAESGRRQVTTVVDNYDPEFFSVYLRHRDGRAVCVGNHATNKRARAYAQVLSSQYGWPVRK